MAELIGLLARLNLAAAVAILAVIAVRPMVRRRYGPEVAYALWIIPLAAAGAMLFPARVVIAPSIRPT
jgi:beta-lactamase regulating signal transducer with metallopeptidase domain